MTWNKPIAPERDVARGSPQDSICMIVATKFGSMEAVFAHRTMSFSQCCTSFVKTGEIPPERVMLSDAKDQIGVTTPVSGKFESPGARVGETRLCVTAAGSWPGAIAPTAGAAVWSNIVESLMGNALGVSGDLRARNVTMPTITRAASGGRI